MWQVKREKETMRRVLALALPFMSAWRDGRRRENKAAAPQAFKKPHATPPEIKPAALSGSAGGGNRKTCRGQGV